MNLDLALSFAVSTPSRARDAVQALRHVPALCDGALRRLEVVRHPASRALLARASLSGATTALLDRLEFWLARAGGRVHAARDVPPALGVQLAGAPADERAREGEPLAAALGARLDRLLRESGVEVEALGPAEARPVLRLQVDGPGWDGITFDRASQTVFVPSPLSPPAGDELELELIVDGARSAGIRVAATVAAATRPRDRDAASPPGYTLALDAQASSACAVLALSCAGRALGARDAPRYRARGQVRLATEAPGGAPLRTRSGHLRNLSYGGALVRIEMPLAVGTRVIVQLALDAGLEVRLRAEVVRAEEGTVAVAFERLEEPRAGLAAFLAAFAGRRRRALVLDQEDARRRAAAAAFRDRGFDVLETADAVHAFQVLSAERSTIDALVAGDLAGIEPGELAHAVRGALGDWEFPVVTAHSGPTLAPPRQTHVRAGAIPSAAEAIRGGDAWRPAERSPLCG